MKKLFTLLVMTVFAMSVSAQRTLVEFIGSVGNTGTFICGSGNVTYSTVRVETNTTTIQGVKFASSHSSEDVIKASKDYLIVKVDGGFKKDDVVTVAGAINNTDGTKSAKVDIFTGLPGEAANVLFTTANVVNGRSAADLPAVETYTLKADADSLCFGRNGNTATYITTLKIVRPNEEAVEDPLTEATTWDFTQLLSEAEASALSADASWTYDSESDAYSFPKEDLTSPNNSNIVLKGGTTEVSFAKGLLFGRAGTFQANKLKLENGKCITFGGGSYTITIPVLVANDVVKVEFASNSKDEERGFVQPENATVTDGALKASNVRSSVSLTMTKKSSLVLQCDMSIKVYALKVNVDDVADAIRDASAPKRIDTAAYNLSGQKVGAAYKGLVLKSGKKYVQK